jgi:phospholipid/cholesterol/gamma-HCH transport system substrate-binding protein
MNKVRISREFRVGTLAVMAIFVLYFGLNFLKGVDVFAPVNYYYGCYEDIDGLVPSAPIYIKGLKVGQVETVKYDFSKELSFTVKISVSRDIKLPQHLVMELFDDGLMGGKAIRLNYQPYKPETALHASGDTLTTTIGTGLLANLTGQLMPQIENVTSQADSLLRSVRMLVENQSLQNSLLALETTSNELAVSAGRLSLLMNNQMPSILNNVKAITGDFSVVSANIRNVDFAGTLQQIDLTIRDLKSLSAKLNDGEGSMGLLLNDPGLYQSLNNAVNSADHLLIDLRQNPKRYVHFSIFGK